MDFNGLLDLFFQRQCEEDLDYSWNPEPDSCDDDEE